MPAPRWKRHSGRQAAAGDRLGGLEHGPQQHQQPAARSSGLAFSISLWLMPFSQGTKIIPAGPSSARKIASWPAPLTMSICGMPSACAASRTAPTHPWSKYSGGKSAVGTSSYCKPCFAGSGDHLADLGDHRVQALRLQMAEVQGHLHFAGYHVARTGIGVQAADRAASMRLMAEGRAIDRLDHRRGTDQGILAQVHRRWPGVPRRRAGTGRTISARARRAPRRWSSPRPRGSAPCSMCASK